MQNSCSHVHQLVIEQAQNFQKRQLSLMHLKNGTAQNNKLILKVLISNAGNAFEGIYKMNRFFLTYIREL